MHHQGLVLLQRGMLATTSLTTGKSYGAHMCRQYHPMCSLTPAPALTLQAAIIFIFITGVMRRPTPLSLSVESAKKMEALLNISSSRQITMILLKAIVVFFFINRTHKKFDMLGNLTKSWVANMDKFKGNIPEISEKS